jgi:hypothetical protein
VGLRTGLDKRLSGPQDRFGQEAKWPHGTFGQDAEWASGQVWT